MPLKKGALLNHLIALAAFSSLVMNDYFQPGWSALGIVLIAASFVSTRSAKKPDRAPRLWNGLSIFFCLFFAADFLWLSRDLLSAGMHFLTYLMVYRLFHLTHSRDALQLYLIGFLQLLAAAGDGSGFGYALSFLFSSFLMVGGLLVQHFKREEESPARAHRTTPAPVPARFFILTPFLSLMILAVTLVFFFLIPRMGIAFFQRKSSTPQRVSGFSEKVDLGSLGPIKLDPSLVMRVVPLAGEKEAFPDYLRGMSFDLYDGKAWRNTLQRKGQLTRGTEGTIPVAEAPRGGPISKKTILLEPLDTSVLFTPGRPVSVQGPFSTLLKDRSGTLYFPSAPLRRTEYEIAVFSEPLLESDRRVVQIDDPFEIRDRYLPVKPGAESDLDRKIAALAEEITAPHATLYEKAAAIENYLKKNYTYTLDVPPSPLPPIEAFLFDDKRGYCEHFASAMVLLLRSIGIASRLVTGFLPGEWNEIGKYYLVRQSDAHAWVEVYFPGERWLAFDPTPSAPSAQNTLFKMTAAYLDWMQLKWDRYIVRYSLQDQFEFVQGAGDRFGDLSGRFSSSLAGWKRAFGSIAGGAALPLGLALLGGLLLFLVKRNGWRRESGRVGPIALFYAEMLRILAGKGLIKKPYQTPFEFIETIRTAGTPFLQESAGITEIYCRVRFGGKTLSAEEERKVDRLLKHLRSRR